ncbi:MAG: energy-coupling factor ABC transporter ATP-binding protein [Deltaproteobacteria bacterium]|jgi:energy-coupling factor transporter ATP-binding protein EcfA2|nr:energy-coupling factor ABC transporter ATP-binding protein [Deltaproteobacteria bacterium]
MLRAEGLRFAHPGGRERVGGRGFELPAGRFMILCGANGSGKSTLLDLLAGLERPLAGTVELDGRGDRASLAAGTALLPQEPDYYLLGEDPREELELGLARAEALGRGRGPGGLEGLARAWGLADDLDSPVESLSPGQKKRLAIASALAGGPGAVLLDEPFSGLDWPGTLALLSDLAALKGTGASAVIATHEPYLLRDLADCWLMLRRGGSLFTRDPADLKRLPEFGARPYPGGAG